MPTQATPGGIKRKHHQDHSLEMTVPEFAMPPDAVPGIAQVIVRAWQGDPALDQIITDRVNGVAGPTAVAQATAAINAALGGAGYSLKRAVIISEEEHDDGYTMETRDDVVFVLPNASRLKKGGDLLETAKLLMACTPNGI